MIYLLGFFSDIGFSIRQALRTLCGQLAAVLYNFIVDLYNVFMIVARAEILDNKYIQAIYNRVGMILGLFMLFKLVFSLIQSLVDPNKFTDDKKGFVGIIKRSIISIVLLGITPTIFRMAFDVQGLIVGTENNSNNIIYKFIVADAEYETAESFGHTIATDLYFSFYTENEPLKLMEGVEIEYPDDEAVLKVLNYDYLKTQIKSGDLDFYDTVDYLTLTSGGMYIIDWNELFSIGMALVIIWLLITYTIQVATRVVQLAYLQLVAPVPILSYISDPDGSFKNWIKQCTSTYLDLFLRLAIIYFIIALSTQILNIFADGGNVLMESTGLKPGDSATIWVKLFLIVGLLMFGKKVPDLLKDLFPSMGSGSGKFNFGLTSPKKLAHDIPGVGGLYDKSAKAIGWSGRKIGQGAKWVGTKATKPITGRYQNWKSDLKSKQEYKEQEKPGKKLYDKYATADGGIVNAFSNDDFKSSYKALKNAKDENRAAEREYELAKSSGDQTRLENALSAKNEAAKKLKDAEKWHENNRKRYGADARKQDQFDRYKEMHPDQFRRDNGSSSRQSANNPTVVNPSLNSNQNSSNNLSSIQPSSDNSQYNPHYASQAVYDDRIEYATERLQELANNGASQEEIDNQRSALETLEKNKKYSAEVDRTSAENVAAADDQFNDDWMSQGMADNDMRDYWKDDN